MKVHIILVISFIFSLTLLAQPNISVIYNLNEISNRPSINKPLHSSKDFTVRLLNIDSNCRYYVNGTEYNCPRGSNADLKFKNGTINQTDVTYPDTVNFYVTNIKGRSPAILANLSSIQGIDTSFVATPPPYPPPGVPGKTIPIATRISGPKLLWQDAINLENALQRSDTILMQEVLSKYFFYVSPVTGSPYSIPFRQLYLDAKKMNVFLGAVLPQVDSWESNNSGNPAADSQSIPLDRTTKNVTSPTILLDAIATVIAKRLVDELNMAYLNRFRDYLERQPEAKTLLPKTTLYLTSFGKGYTADYKNLLNGLRQNIFNDLKALSINGATYLKKYTAETVKTEHKDLLAGAIMGLRIIQGLQNDEKPAMIIHELGQLDFGDYLNSSKPAIIDWVKLGARVSDHLRVDQGNGNWINGANLEQFSKNPRAIYLLAGLIIQTDSTLIEHLLPSLNAISPNQEAESEKIVSIIYQTLAIIRDFNEVYKVPYASTFNNTPPDMKTDGRYFTFATSILDHLCKLVEIEDPNQRTMIDSVKTVSKQLLENIHEKNFVAAGVDLFSLIAAVAVEDASKTEIFRYLSFGQNLVNATNKEELVAAIEEAAEPVGSYRLKRYHPFTASITAYPGISFGYEASPPYAIKDLTVNNFGFTAPIGLAFSWASVGNLDSLKAHNSWSIFLPVLDLGALTYFRLQDQQADIPELQWKNFISPGLGLTLGLKKSPLSFMAIAQYGPEAVSIDETMLETSKRLWRINLGVNVDLHLWNIYTKPKALP